MARISSVGPILSLFTKTLCHDVIMFPSFIFGEYICTKQRTLKEDTVKT
jgi:hypothetical protein